MPNQYNVRNLGNVPSDSSSENKGDGYPIPSASGIGGVNSVSVPVAGVFPTKSDAEWTLVFQQDASATPGDLTRNPKPSASGIGGLLSVGVIGAFNAGEGADAVIDFVDAPFNLNTNPWAASGLDV